MKLMRRQEVGGSGVFEGIKGGTPPSICLTPTSSSHLLFVSPPALQVSASPRPPPVPRSPPDDAVCVQLSSSMAALWLQSFSLLVLLVVSWPGSGAMNPPQHLCGSHLVDALYLVCGDSGFFYNPKRDVDPLLGETKNCLLTALTRKQFVLSLNNFYILDT